MLTIVLADSATGQLGQQTARAARSAAVADRTASEPQKRRGIEGVCRCWPRRCQRASGSDLSLTTKPEERLAAIVDFTFNLGAGRLQTSTLRRRINQRDWQLAGFELRRWIYGGGRVLPGLVARRTREVELLLSLQ